MRRWPSAFVLVVLVGCGGDSTVDAGPARVDAGLDASAPDAGVDAGVDAGPIDGPCTSPPLAGSIGGFCGPRDTCDARSTCAGGVSVTLGDLGIAVGTPDADHPGEYLAGAPSTIPITFAPAGMCTTGCRVDGSDDACGPCAVCRRELGAPPRLSVLASLDALTPFDGDGVCRAPCDFDPEARGDCPDGFTCDGGAMACVEACVSDAQCRAAIGGTADGRAVVYEVGAAVCDAATGRCRWPTPPGAGFGTACAIDEDCPRDLGHCYFGRCTSLHCDLDDYPCPAGAHCYEGAAPAICLPTCTTIDDCPAQRTCQPLDDGGPNVCSAVCSASYPCRPDERCFHVFADPALGVCQPFCDPHDAGVPGAVACAVTERCRGVEGTDHGACQPEDARCYDDLDCAAGQTCARAEPDEFYGRCTTP